MLARARPTGRRRTAVEIRSIFKGYRESGLSLLAFARQQRLCYTTLRRWRAAYGGPAQGSRWGGASGRSARNEEGSARLVTVEVDGAARPGEFILDWACGRSLRIPADFDPGQLRRLLAILGVRP